MKDDAVYLRHILDAVAKVEHYTAGGRDAFFADPMIQDAVLRNLEIIGEAVRNLSPDLRRRHPEVPWRSITALRNVHRNSRVHREAILGLRVREIDLVIHLGKVEGALNRRQLEGLLHGGCFR
jgi:uncharacterized protein with HEPN domain